jgi:uncharacterized membrane protein
MGESSTTTKKYPLSFAVLTAATFLCAVFLIVTSVPTTGLKGSILGVSFFLALMVFAELLYIPLPKGGGVSVSFAVILACLAIYGPGVAALVSGVGLFLALVLPSRSFDLKYLFNFGQIAIAAWLGGKAFLMAGGDLKNGQLVGNIGSLLVASAVYFLANAGLVTAGCAVGYRQSFKSIWYANVKTNIPSFLALVPLGTLVALVYMGYGIPGSLLLLVPLLFARYSFLQTLDARKATVSVTQALAAALEAKDSYTRGHSDRVAAYAVEVARELRLGEDDVETIRCAAEMHDIGKIGTPESLLNKPASLTETELAEVRKHALIGSICLKEWNSSVEFERSSDTIMNGLTALVATPESWWVNRFLSEPGS